MINSDFLEHTGFHDSEVVAMRVAGDNVQIVFENVAADVDGNEYYRVKLDLGGAYKMTRDGQVVHALQTEGEGSSVIQFERSGDTATLVLDWRHYAARRSETRAYEIHYRTFSMEYEKQDQFIVERAAEHP